MDLQLNWFQANVTFSCIEQASIFAEVVDMQFSMLSPFVLFIILCEFSYCFVLLTFNITMLYHKLSENFLQPLLAVLPVSWLFQGSANDSGRKDWGGMWSHRRILQEVSSLAISEWKMIKLKRVLRLVCEEGITFFKKDSFPLVKSTMSHILKGKKNVSLCFIFNIRTAGLIQQGTSLFLEDKEAVLISCHQSITIQVCLQA